MQTTRYRIANFACLAFILATACTGAPAPTEEMAPATENPDVQAATSTFTAAPPTETATPLPPSPTTTATETPTATPTATRPVGLDPNALINYYFVLDTGGPVGCGDLMIAVTIGIQRTGDPGMDVQAALEALFENKSVTVLGLNNPIAPSNIRVESVIVTNSAKHVEVETTGTLVKTKDSCEWTRIRVQVNSTALNAAAGYSVNIMLNGHPFNDYVSSDRP